MPAARQAAPAPAVLFREKSPAAALVKGSPVRVANDSFRATFEWTLPLVLL
jgi:hypothetical protein